MGLRVRAEFLSYPFVFLILWFFLFISLFISSFTSIHAETLAIPLRPTPYIGHIERPDDPFPQIQVTPTFKVFLNLSQTKAEEILAEVFIRQKQSSSSQLIVLSQQTVLPIQAPEKSEGWTNYRFLIPLSKAETPLRISLVNAKGIARHQIWKLRLSEWETVLAAPKTVTVSKPWSLSFQSAVTQIQFIQSFLPEIRQMDLTGKLSASYTFGSSARSSARPWSISSTTYLTLMPLIAPSDPSYTARFFGSNVRLGYSWAFDDRWILGFHTGLYYLTVLPTEAEFGFRNMVGPQLFPTLTWRMNSKHALSAYYKYSPVIQYGTGLNFQNREEAGGLSYSGAFWPTLSLLLGMDVSQVDIRLAGITIYDRTVGFSVGLRH
jgi:hypothetical protein